MEASSVRRLSSERVPLAAKEPDSSSCALLQRERMTRAWFVALSLAYLEFSTRVGTAPICAYGQDGCPVPSLADFVDRVVQQSSRMHGISSSLHSESEQYFLPKKNLIGKRKCHTYGIPTPVDKENAQRLGREQLIEVILKLLAAWTDPLSQFHQSKDLHQFGSNKALEISDMMHELRDGVTKMADKMRLLGELGNAVSDISPESFAPLPAFSFYARGELDSVDHHDLLFCLHRDSNKIKNYLRVLKCTTIPGLDC